MFDFSTETTTPSEEEVYSEMNLLAKQILLLR